MPRLLRAVRLIAVAVLTGALAAPAPVALASAGEPPPDVYQLLENPETTAVGQEPPHAELTPYADTAGALEGRSRTPWVRSLDGTWKIHMSDRPEDVPRGFYAEGYDTGGAGWRGVTVPHTWQTDGLDHPMF